MKIDQLPDIAAAAGSAGVNKAAPGAQPAAAAPAAVPPEAAEGVPVTVSPLARSLEPVAAGPGVDVERVAQVREAIANGTYKVDAEAIADRMLSDAQQILSRNRG